MKKRIKENTGTKRPADLKRSTANLFLDIIIFLLLGIIILMSWSIYNKFRGEEPVEIKEQTEQPASEIIQVEVLNGCGVSGVADRFTDYLRDRKFDVVNIGNYITFDVMETMVIDRIGNLTNAKKVAEALGIKPGRAFSQLNSDYFLDVSIIIGKDYHELNPVK